jgi:hypothetical protein
VVSWSGDCAKNIENPSVPERPGTVTESARQQFSRATEETSMKARRTPTFIVCSLVALLAACGGGTQGVTGTPSLNLVPVHGVTMRASLAGRGPSGDTVVVTFTNAGADTAFRSRCGSQPLLLSQQFVNDTWTGGVQNFMCPMSDQPGPVALIPGATLQLVRFFDAAGRYRFLVSVGSIADLSDAQRDMSNVLDVP